MALVDDGMSSSIQREVSGSIGDADPHRLFTAGKVGQNIPITVDHLEMS